jgi:DNA-directed RNA polymerase III subunit RPC6
MQTLVYDGAIEEVRAPRQLARLDIGTKMFKVCRPVEDMDHLTTTPCGICEVQAHCSPGNVISPDSCIYLDKWLDLEDIGMDME